MEIVNNNTFWLEYPTDVNYKKCLMLNIFENGYIEILNDFNNLSKGDFSWHLVIMIEIAVTYTEV